MGRRQDRLNKIDQHVVALVSTMRRHAHGYMSTRTYRMHRDHLWASVRSDGLIKPVSAVLLAVLPGIAGGWERDERAWVRRQVGR